MKFPDFLHYNISQFASIDDFKKVLSGSECLESFSPEVFDLLVETILVGGYMNGEPDPYLITFVFKGGSQRSIDGSGFKEDRRRKKALHPVWNNEGVELHIDNKEEAHSLLDMRPLFHSVSSMFSSNRTTSRMRSLFQPRCIISIFR